MQSNLVQSRLWSEPARRWVAHVDMDAFFASVEQLDDSKLLGLPVVVANSPMTVERLRELSEGARGRAHVEFIRGVRGVVASASYAARAFGVRSAMPLARALVLCPDAIVLPGRFDRYREVAAHLRRIWSDFSPVIEPMSLDEAYLDMTGCELAGGPVRGIAERLKKRIRDETGLTASIGMASSKLVAKIASDLEKPDGLVIVLHGMEAEMLAPLHIRALPGVGPKTAEVLARLGITTIGELAHSRLEVLAGEFGHDHAASLLERSVGIDRNPVEVPGDPKSVSNEITFEDDSSDLAFLKSRLKELSDRVSWRLRKDGYMARCVYIKLRLLPRKRGWTPEGTAFAKPITRRCTLPMPVDSAQEIYGPAERLFDAVAREKGLVSGERVVRLLGVGTSALCPIENIVINLPRRTEDKLVPASRPRVDPPTQEMKAEAPLRDNEKVRRLNASIDEIRARYGFSAITLATSSKDVIHDDGHGHSD